MSKSMMWARTVGIALVALSIPSLAVSAKAPPESKCRQIIAKQTKTLIAKALKSLDGCHKKRDAGKSSADCNAVSLSTLAAKFPSKIGKACKPGNPALANYPGDPGVLIPQAVQEVLAASGAYVQGSPTLNRDKPKVKCHTAIGKARSAVVREVVGSATSCQANHDKTDKQYPPLLSDCIASSGGAGGDARGQIASACGAIAGADVGSCDPLPGCVIDDAKESARILSQAIYGPVSICGNGVRELDEECDDGNRNDDDSCTRDCKNVVCGDGIVSAGEECDDKNNINTDSCTRICSGPNPTDCVCHAARCGDGFVQAGEQCDDGNDASGDGCSSCTIDPTPCTPGVGVNATVSIGFDAVSRDLWGVVFALDYSGLVSIPGHAEDLSVQDSITDAACTCNDPPACADRTCVGQLWVGNDQDQNSDGTDDRLRVVYTAAAAVPETPQASVVTVKFDCPSQGLVRASDFTCGVVQTSDPNGEEIPGAETCSVALGVPAAP